MKARSNICVTRGETRRWCIRGSISAYGILVRATQWLKSTITVPWQQSPLKLTRGFACGFLTCFAYVFVFVLVQTASTPGGNWLTELTWQQCKQPLALICLVLHFVLYPCTSTPLYYILLRYYMKRRALTLNDVYLSGWRLSRFAFTSA